MTTDQLLLDLREARRYITEHRLIKVYPVSDPTLIWDGQDCCAMGALMIVINPGHVDGRPMTVEVRNRLARAGRALTRELDGMPVEVYNDMIDTTKSDILSLYDRAIARLETQFAEGL